MSSVTFLIVAWITFNCRFSGAMSCTVPDGSHSPAWFSSIIKRQTRARKRETPSTPFMLHGFICSSGPMNIS